MKGLRRPDTAEILKINASRTEDAIRFAPDIVFLPTSFPPNSASGITISGNQYQNTTTGYLTACAFQIIPCSACLNVGFWGFMSGGPSFYIKLVNDGVTLYEVNGAANAYFSKSFPSFSNASGDLHFELRSTTAGYGAGLQVSRMFLSSRPFYSY